jgi:hypothetical protein
MDSPGGNTTGVPAARLEELLRWKQGIGVSFGLPRCPTSKRWQTVPGTVFYEAAMIAGISGYAFWLVAIAFVLLILGTLIKSL